MAKLKEPEDCEREVERYAKRRIKEGEVVDVDIESTTLIARGRHGKYPTYKIRGFAKYKVKGLIRSKIKKKEFTAQVNARSGKVIEFVEH